MDGGGGDMATPVQKRAHEAWRVYKYYLDKTTPHSTYRWIGTLVVFLIYCLRVFSIHGFYIISYGLGIYLLNLLIGFLSPLVDPELDASDGGASLPTRGSDEFKPFIRRLPEFKYSMTKAFCIAFLMTFFSVFDVPVFWPILLCYWVVLFVLTMRRQISHMIKHKYIPFSIGKQVSLFPQPLIMLFVRVYGIPAHFDYKGHFRFIVTSLRLKLLTLYQTFDMCGRNIAAGDLLLVVAALVLID